MRVALAADPVRRAGPPAPRRADQLPRPRGHALALRLSRRATRTAMVVISHDRDLLDTCGRPHPPSRPRQALALSSGGYTSFAKQLSRETPPPESKFAAEAGGASASTCRPSSTASAPRPPRRARRNRGSSGSPSSNPIANIAGSRTTLRGFDPALARNAPPSPPLLALEGRRRPAMATRTILKKPRPDYPAGRPDRAARLRTGNGKSTFCKLDRRTARAAGRRDQTLRRSSTSRISPSTSSTN